MRHRSLTALALGLVLPLAACDRARPGADEETPSRTVPPVSAPAAATPAAPGQPAAPSNPATANPTDVTLPSSPLASNPGEIQRMPVDEAAALHASGQAVFVDVRDASSFAAEHVEGAVHLPLGEIASRGGELPRDKTIVTYCS